MILIKNAVELQNWMSKQKLKSLKIGFIPTMGALHKGHISLITNSKSQNLLTVCSIFVNPTQFNDPSDFAKYPQTIESDILALEKAGTDLLFLPNQAQIYPLGTENQPNYDLGNLENLLEGKYRPGHFQGVCQVVDRLLELVQPDKLFLGQKDFQQCMVIQKLLALKQSQTELIICPTLREASGLAMSSRNMRLSIEGRQKAAMIYQVLRNIQTNLLSNATIEELLEEGKSSLLVAGFDSIDYLELVAVQSLEDIPNWEPNIQAVLIIAVYLEGVRLIDNLPI
ncbi:MAG TPA: pantoate--beta-alanine ligase [Sediminibacterium sp.]|jgi:pantoate--beta-alanine ligase|nr:MAG: pantoate--beta-alanine ligase [Sphingobacteriia bacterium 39-39-8]HQR94435.1 pantoate--beta-alanine ligase [Sediminibacterium sp.]HQS56593.1 pantoate--beta-alanine ligase [Sediminibacterium sp.]